MKIPDVVEGARELQRRQYGLREYFAFVESTDSFLERQSALDWVSPLMARRSELRLGLASHVLWLDCVEAGYLSRLPWLAEECPLGDLRAADRRRNRINELDRSQFRAVFLLLSQAEPGEGLWVDQLTESSWHLATIGAEIGAPVFTAPDYDLDPAARLQQRLYIDRPCDDSERAVLLNVFNLNFLQDRDDGGGGRDPWPNEVDLFGTAKKMRFEQEPPPKLKAKGASNE